MAKKKTSHKNTPKQEKEYTQYEGTLYSLTYEANEDICTQAAVLYGHPRYKDASILLTLLGMLCFLANLAFKLNNLFLVLVGLIFAVTGAIAMRNWPNIQAWALMGTNLGASSDDIWRRVVITNSEVIVEGPGTNCEHYPLKQLKRVRVDDHGCLASFGKARVAYLPAGILSRVRQREAEEFLKSQLTK